MKNMTEILKSEKDFPDNKIENNVVESVKVDTIAHYGNITSFEIRCRNIIPYSGRNNINNLGHVIRAFIELMGLEREDGIRLDEIKDIPCRLIFDCEKGEGAWGSSAIGIGHFMNDKFVLFDDLAKVGIED